MLTIKDASIINPEGKQVFLHGVNLGGGLMMEGYILHGRNIAEKIFKSEFKKRLGRKELASFAELYRDNFIQVSDFKEIASSGLNCIRLPFNYRLLEEKNGLKILKNAVALCKKYHIHSPETEDYISRQFPVLSLLPFFHSLLFFLPLLCY